MQNDNVNGAVLQKTLELCQAILAEPELAAARRNVDAFMADEKAREQYQGVMTKGQELHRKQHDGRPVAQQEISEFETCRDQLLSNPVARNFLDAQEQMQQVHQTVSGYVGKTLELGRVPTPEDFESESCDGAGGCGCGHHH